MGDLYVQEGGIWHITGGLERLIGHAHVEPDEKRGITAHKQKRGSPNECFQRTRNRAVKVCGAVCKLLGRVVACR